MCVYTLVAVLRKQLSLSVSLHKILQILSVNAFEKVSILELLTHSLGSSAGGGVGNQLLLFDL